jgi:hypothetical protein
MSVNFLQSRISRGDVKERNKKKIERKTRRVKQKAKKKKGSAFLEIRGTKRHAWESRPMSGLD